MKLEYKNEASRPWLAQLLAEQKQPCISIYLPMNRANPPAAENARLYRDLVDKMRDELRTRYDETVVQSMTEKVKSIDTGSDFWTGDRDGIAVFASPDQLQVIDLLDKVDAQVHVADSFHIKPLIPILQSADRYQLLCLEMKSVRIFEGNRWRLEKLELQNTPFDQSEAAGMTLSKTSSSASDLTQSPRQSDQGGGTEPVPPDAFCRAVDRAIWENYSRPSGLPLILCADEKTNALFRGVSKNPQLMEQSIMLDPKALPLDRMREEAWKIIEPIYQQRIEKVTNDFRVARAHQQGSDDPAVVAEAASTGRVGTLLVAADRQLAGKLTQGSDVIQQAPMAAASSDDVLDDLAEMVLRMDGQVMVLPQMAMPTDTGVAAIFRY